MISSDKGSSSRVTALPLTDHGFVYTEVLFVMPNMRKMFYLLVLLHCIRKLPYYSGIIPDSFQLLIIPKIIPAYSACP